MTRAREGLSGLCGAGWDGSLISDRRSQNVFQKQFPGAGPTPLWASVSPSCAVEEHTQ